MAYGPGIGPAAEDILDEGIPQQEAQKVPAPFTEDSVKEDEKLFARIMLTLCHREDAAGNIAEGPRPRDIINMPGFPIPYKRAWYYLDKWSGRGWYNYGTTADLGWLTQE